MQPGVTNQSILSILTHARIRMESKTLSPNTQYETTLLLPCRHRCWNRYMDLGMPQQSMLEEQRGNISPSSTGSRQLALSAALEFCFHFTCLCSFLAIPAGWASINWLARNHTELVCRSLPFIERALNTIRLTWIGVLGLLVWTILNMAMNCNTAVERWLSTVQLRSSAQMLLVTIPVSCLLLEQYLQDPGPILDCRTYMS